MVRTVRFPYSPGIASARTPVARTGRALLSVVANGACAVCVDVSCGKDFAGQQRYFGGERGADRIRCRSEFERRHVITLT